MLWGLHVIGVHPRVRGYKWSWADGTKIYLNTSEWVNSGGKLDNHILVSPKALDGVWDKQCIP